MILQGISKRVSRYIAEVEIYRQRPLPYRPSVINARCFASMASVSRITALAKEIEINTTKLDKFFTESQLPPPSFDENAPLMYPFPPDVAEAQEALSAALDELWWLNQGPIQTIVAKSVNF
jgi:hypothetical protein